MAQQVLLKGNEVMAEAAIRAGCRFFAGYPITPQNEVPEYMSRRMPEVGGVFIQAESELAAINMIFGASATGTRCMTSSSSPGISLKQEGISYIAAAELPCVIANMQRGGPGLGNIRGAQGDYFQAVKGGGHGDYRLLVFAPSTLQELYDLTQKAFDYSDYYRIPALILGDGILGQMVEPVEMNEYEPCVDIPEKDYVLSGCEGRKPRVVKTLLLNPADELAHHNEYLRNKYQQVSDELQWAQTVDLDDADIAIAAYGITARIAIGAAIKAREEGIKVGVIRPITLWPFPKRVFENLPDRISRLLVVEMSNGQMIEDVELATRCRYDVDFLGTGGGWYPTPENILEKIRKIAGRRVSVQ